MEADMSASDSASASEPSVVVVVVVVRCCLDLGEGADSFNRFALFGLAAPLLPPALLLLARGVRPEPLPALLALDADLAGDAPGLAPALGRLARGLDLMPLLLETADDAPSFPEPVAAPAAVDRGDRTLLGLLLRSGELIL